jgi:cytochrome c2
MRRSSAVLTAVLLGTAGLAAAARAQPAGDAAKGAEAFDDRCSQCHTTGPAAQGPNLAGVVGRKAGTLPEFPYTAAMKGSGLTWTADNLERFLANSQGLVPGTAMSVTVPSAAERANIVAYLAAQKGR